MASWAAKLCWSLSLACSVMACTFSAFPGAAIIYCSKFLRGGEDVPPFLPDLKVGATGYQSWDVGGLVNLGALLRAPSYACRLW